jgi:hypothetical protein
MFQNRSDSALQDLMIHDIVPSSFEIKGYNIRSDSGVREAEMEKADDENGIKVTWHIPVIEKDERIEVIYELVGDSDTEYKVSEAQEFHGATFGDELDVDLPPPAPEEEEEDEEDIEELEDDGASDDSDDGTEDDETDDDEGDAEDDGGDDDSDDGTEDDETDDDEGDAEDDGGDDDSEDVAEDDGGDDDSEDVAEDDDGDDDVTMDAALAQITGASASDEESDDSAEDVVEEASEEPEDAPAEEGRTCPICSSVNAPGANVCSTCSFDFE